MRAKEPPFVGVVTFNPFATVRFELLEQTVRSIERAFPTCELFLRDNGSTDGSWDAVCELLGRRGIFCGECHEHQYGRWHVRQGLGGIALDDTTPGSGRNRLWSMMFAHVYANLAEDRSPFWVWSDDDMLWKEGAEQKLRRFWRQAPDDVIIVSGLLEPEWDWNTPRGVVEAGGVRALVRDSAPGAAWTFRNPRSIEVGCGADPSLFRFGYDYESCKRLREVDLKVAQLDLADHIGWGYSTHGNEADMAGKPLDRDKWGI